MNGGRWAGKEKIRETDNNKCWNGKWMKAIVGGSDKVGVCINNKVHPSFFYKSLQFY
jgi:hypothetical protein